MEFLQNSTKENLFQQSIDSKYVLDFFNSPMFFNVFKLRAIFVTGGGMDDILGGLGGTNHLQIDNDNELW